MSLVKCSLLCHYISPGIFPFFPCFFPVNEVDRFDWRVVLWLNLHLCLSRLHQKRQIDHCAKNLWHHYILQVISL